MPAASAAGSATVPFILLDTKRIRALGWKPKFTIREGVERTVDWLTANRWVFEQRP